jgi:hypothetical protein
MMAKTDSGQANVEYILMLLVGVSAFLLLYSQLLGPAMKQFETQLSQKINAAVFQGDFHSLNIGH